MHTLEHVRTLRYVRTLHLWVPTAIACPYSGTSDTIFSCDQAALWMVQSVRPSHQKTTTETLHHQWPEVITEEMSEETSLDHDQTGPKTSPEPHRRIADPHRRITINILEILELPIFAYHTYYTSKHMYNWMKWLRLLGGWHFIAATAIKPPKAACQFAADDILLYKICYNIQWIYFTIWEKGKEELSPLQYHLSLYISYQDITRRVC